jgi:hypothetical protein
MDDHSRFTRREFLRFAALAGATITPASALALGDDDPEPRKLVRRTLGRTGLELPIVSMGACYAVNLIQAALQEGIVHFHS